MHLTQTDIEKICYGFLDDVKSNGYQVTLTRGGNVVIILNRSAGFDYPLLGAYFTGSKFNTGEWVPCKWSEKGEFAIGQVRALDLIMESEKEDGAA